MTFKSLPKNISLVITLLVIFSSSTLPTLAQVALTNTAEVKSNQPDSNPNNNIASITNPKYADISGNLFNDLNQNGIKEQNEEPMIGVKMLIKQPDNTLLEAITDNQGNFSARTLAGNNEIKVGSNNSGIPEGTIITVGSLDQNLDIQTSGKKLDIGFFLPQTSSSSSASVSISSISSSISSSSSLIPSSSSSSSLESSISSSILSSSSAITSAPSSSSISSVNQIPNVVILTPTMNQDFVNPNVINMTGTASDIDGTVTKVEIFDGATKLGDAILNGSNWSFDLTSFSPNTNPDIIVKVTDNLGATNQTSVRFGIRSLSSAGSSSSAISSSSSTTSSSSSSLVSASSSSQISSISSVSSLVSSTSSISLAPTTPQPNLAITKTVDKTSVKVQESLVYSLKFSNKGSRTATDVQIIDQLPTNLEYMAAMYEGQIVTPAVMNNSNGQKLTFTIPTLDPNQPKEILVTARIKDTPDNKVINQVNIISHEADPDITDNQATISVDITRDLISAVIATVRTGGKDMNSSQAAIFARSFVFFLAVALLGTSAFFVVKKRSKGISKGIK
jgi:uncharacterized repeat protein (TIGR01451 family)